MTSPGNISFATGSDLDSFVGVELTGVNVWKFGVSLIFNGEARSIMVENNAEFQSQGRTEIYNQEIIVAFGARMLSLIGRHIVALTAADKTVAMDFDDGSKLILQPDNSGYESYSIYLPNGSIFVG